MTFGCPLRQLYSLRFPYQYAWSGENTGYQDVAALHGPDPDTLGVQSWSNLYSSGDYVGRYLWYPDDYEHQWKTTWSDEMPDQERAPSYTKAREKCIGYGSHLIYWKGNHPDVAQELDRLIGQSIQGAGKETHL
jgi:hypothetical protein